MRMFYIKLLNTSNDKLISYRKMLCQTFSPGRNNIFSKESQINDQVLKQNCLGQAWWQIKVSQTEGLY